MNRFSQCLSALEKVAEALGAPLAVVGGLAAIHHGAQVGTLDVDIAAPKAKLEELLAVAAGHGFELRARSPRGWHRLLFKHPDGDVEVHVVPEGEKSPRDPPHAPANPGPAELGVTKGLGYAAFAPWFVTKLAVGRDKDRYHLVEVLKRATPLQVSEVVTRVRQMHPSYLAEFERLVRAAEEEKGQQSW